MAKKVVDNVKNRRVSVSFEKVVNKGNYESEKYRVGIEFDIDDNEDVEEVYQETFDFLFDVVDEAIEMSEDED